MIDHIKVIPANTGFDLELYGELSAIMAMVTKATDAPQG
ncbi:hypothetical protein RB2083_3351 [Rhodobacteraceae bacterium HTCC2083]|nr:hypothetical protein RB2083_3351 [Rhodobacteraceae bacterium HTCC2083]